MRGKVVKLKNRRVGVGRRSSDDAVCLFFKRLKEENDKIYSISEVTGKIVKTTICISKAAAVALYMLLRDTIKIDDIVTFEEETEQKIFID